ncbi:MAG: hypothetical protein ABJL71_18540, partial [Cyclobacteriaceae bacterium]
FISFFSRERRLSLFRETLSDRVAPTDTIETKPISDQAIIVLLTDKRNRLISKNKIGIQVNK